MPMVLSFVSSMIGVGKGTKRQTQQLVSPDEQATAVMADTNKTAFGGAACRRVERRAVRSAQPERGCRGRSPGPPGLSGARRGPPHHWQGSEHREHPLIGQKPGGPGLDG